jgi:hypothetical protein
MRGQGIMTAFTGGFLPREQGLALRAGLAMASGTCDRLMCPRERKVGGVMIEGILGFGPSLRGVAGFAAGGAGFVLKLCPMRIIVRVALRTGQRGEGKYASSWWLIGGAVGPRLCIGTMALLTGNEHMSAV